MKLATRITSTFLLAAVAFWLAAPAAAQAQPATQPTTQPVGQFNPTGGLPQTAAPGSGGDLQAAADADPSAVRTAMIQAIQDEMGLPAQTDTGPNSPNGLWMPQAASSTAASTDGVFWYITIVTIIFTVLNLGLMFFFAFWYRRRRDDEPDPENVSTHSTTLELTWTIIPTCIVLVMFTLGFRDFLSQTVAPRDSYEVRVTGQMWNWSFTYPNGAITSDLHVPRDRPVKFTLASQDVLHSFFVPAWRIKKDVVPGRFNQIWAEPTVEGIFEVYCTEYCGTNHSRMIAKAFVYAPDKYDAMLARISNIYFDFSTGLPNPPEKVGQALWSGRGCQGCHSIDGSILQAPSWKNLYGAQRTFTDGSSAIADDNYIRQSILQPQARLVSGYVGAGMPSYAGQLDDRDIASIIAFMKTLSDGAKEVGESGETVGPDQSQSLGGREQDRGEGRQQPGR